MALSISQSLSVVCLSINPTTDTLEDRLKLYKVNLADIKRETKGTNMFGDG